MEQRKRDQVLIQFSNRSCSVMVATDVAARGLDIAQLEAVINVDVTPDPEIHIHRIGCADENGWALSLCSASEISRLEAITKMIKFEPEWHDLSSLLNDECTPLISPMASLQILGGRKEKIRPGDVLGALTGEVGYPRE